MLTNQSYQPPNKLEIQETDLEELRITLIKIGVGHFRRCFRYVDMDAVQDAVQVTLITIWKAIEKGRIDKTKGALAYSITCLKREIVHYAVRENKLNEVLNNYEETRLGRGDTEGFADWIDCLDIDIRNIAICLMEMIKQSDMAQLLHLDNCEIEARIEELRTQYLEYNPEFEPNTENDPP